MHLAHEGGEPLISSIIEALDEADALLSEYLAECAAGYALEDDRVAEAAEGVRFALKHLRREAGE